MFDLLIHANVFAAGWVVGHYGFPWIWAHLKPLFDARAAVKAIEKARKFIADEEAKAAALANARKIVASAPAAVDPAAKV